MSNQIRVLHMISSLNIGGSQTFVMNLYRNIDREKIQFDFIIDHPNDIYFKNEIEQLGGKVYFLPTFKGNNIAEIVTSWNQFFITHPEYKVLHSHSRSYASIYLPIAKKHGIKTIIHSHSTSNGKKLSSIVKAILQYPLRYQADYFMACSKEAGAWLFGNRVCNKDRFYIVNNAIDSKHLIFDSNKRLKYRTELGINSEFTLGYLARVSESKNPLFVIDVFEELKKINPNAKLLFVGDGALLPKVKERANELNVRDSAIFTGARSDVENMLFAMDCYILPSLWEGLGISLIEAQASGLNCICSENIQKEAIVSNLVEQLKISDGASVWAKTISDLETRAVERKDMSEHIRHAGFDICENAIKLQEFYMSISV